MKFTIRQRLKLRQLPGYTFDSRRPHAMTLLASYRTVKLGPVAHNGIKSSGDWGLYGRCHRVK